MTAAAVRDLFSRERLARMVGNVGAVLELSLLACKGDQSEAIAAMIGALVALAGASPERAALLRTAERTLSTTRERWEAEAACALQDDLLPFVDGELEPERAASFRIHLVNCRSCRVELVQVEQLQAHLSTLDPDRGAS